jgi:hypothetical protein
VLPEGKPLLDAPDIGWAPDVIEGLTVIAPRDAAARFFNSVIIRAHSFMNEKESP